MRTSLDYARLSQINLGFWIIVCTVLAPQYFFSWDQGGVTNYGLNTITVVPFTLAFLGCSYLMFRSVHLLSSTTHRRTEIKMVIYTVAVFYVLMLVSTYTYQVNVFLTYLHQVVSLMTVKIQLAAGIWLYILNQKEETGSLFLGIFIIGFALGTLTILDVVRLLFTAQIIVGIGFGGLYIHSFRKLTH